MIDSNEIKRVKGLGFLNNRNTDNFSARVITGNGVISAEEAQVVIDAVNKYGNGYISFTSRQTIECPGIPYKNIKAFTKAIEAGGLEIGGTGPKVRPVVSCKGSICQYGLIDTFGVATKIHERFYKGFREKKLPHKFKIAVGGCPNNCVKPSLNDVGIIGQSVPQLNADACKECSKCQVESSCPLKAVTLKGGKPVIDASLCVNCGLCIAKCPFDAMEESFRGYQILVGGRWGKKGAVGQPLSPLFETATAVLDTLEKLILFYEANGNPGERFALTIDRLGLDALEKAIFEA